MINNYWEELDMSFDILNFHEELLKQYNLPKWTEINCPYCNEKLTRHSIREIGLKFNTRNIGDIVLEFCCEKCCKMNTFYYRKEAENINDFISVLNGEKMLKSEPVLEENMFKLQYNNAVEKMRNI